MLKRATAVSGGTTDCGGACDTNVMHVSTKLQLCCADHVAIL